MFVLARYTTEQIEETGADDSALFYITEEGGEIPMELFKLFGTIAINNSDANKAIKDTTGQASSAEGVMSKAFKKIGTAVAVAFSAEKIIQFGKACVESAASVKAMNSQFEQTFKQDDIDLTGKAADAIKRVATESNILDTRLKGVGTSIYAFAKTTGMESTEALGMMERALKVTADSAAYYDRSLEDTSESLKSFLKGNYENDSALGLSCTEVTRNTKANELYGQSFKDLSESQKQLTLLAMVEDANKLSGALGQASREGSGWENVVGNMKAAWEKFQAVIGTPVMEKLIPVIEGITNGISSMTTKLENSTFSFEDFKSKLAALFPVGDSIDKIKNVIQETMPLIEQLGNNYLTTLFNRFKQMGSYISGIVVPVFSLLFNVLTDIGTTIWTAIAPHVTKISNKFTELSTTITEAINTYIVPTFQSFIAMVQKLWDENQDKITKIGTLFEKVFSLIAKIISSGVDTFKMYILPFITWFVNIVKNNLGNIEGFFQSMFDGIGFALDFFIALFEGDWKGMAKAVVNISNNLKEQVSKIFELIGSALGKIVANIASAVTSKFTEMIDKAKTTVKDGLDKIKGFFDKLKLKLPDIKVPKISVKGKFSLDPPSFPEFDVKWNAEGAVFSKPTIAGFANGMWQGVGEAGAEAVAPIDVLQNYVRQAVAEANSNDGTNQMIELLQQQNELLMAMLQKDTSLKIDGREFGRMVNKYA